jgi:hypothetical protein
MMGKLGAESKGQGLENIPLYLQILLGLPPVNQVIFGKG